MIDAKQARMRLAQQKIEKAEVIEKYSNIASSEIDMKYWCALSKLYFTPQSYGIRLENLFKKKHSFNNKTDNESGDAEKNGWKIEIKHSLGSSSGCWSFQQLRPHHDVDYYILGAYDENVDELYYFVVPSDIMYEICKIHGAASHGTQQNNKQQKNIELGLWTGKNYQSWKKLQQYLIEEDDIDEYFNKPK